MKTLSPRFSALRPPTNNTYNPRTLTTARSESLLAPSLLGIS